MKKNTIINAWRYATLALFLGFGLLFLLCTPTENCTLASFIWSLVWSKGVAAGLLVGFGYLFKFWDERGHLESVKSLFADDLTDEGEDDHEMTEDHGDND